MNSYEQLKRQREKQEELRVELEKVKKRRQDRENEKLARDDKSVVQLETVIQLNAFQTNFPF